jgi:hypothetical protein
MPTADSVRLKPDSLCGSTVLRIIAAVFLLASLDFSQVIAEGRAKHGQGSNRSRYIDALANAPKLVTYSDDGAADVTEVGSNAMGIVENPKEVTTSDRTHTLVRGKGMSHALMFEM